MWKSECNKNAIAQAYLCCNLDGGTLQPMKALADYAHCQIDHLVNENPDLCVFPSSKLCCQKLPLNFEGSNGEPFRFSSLSLIKHCELKINLKLCRQTCRFK